MIKMTHLVLGSCLMPAGTTLATPVVQYKLINILFMLGLKYSTRISEHDTQEFRSECEGVFFHVDAGYYSPSTQPRYKSVKDLFIDLF